MPKGRTDKMIKGCAKMTKCGIQLNAESDNFKMPIARTTF